MPTSKQRFVLALVIAFGLGVLITLERVGTDAEARIHAARRMALECIEPGPVEMIADPQTTPGEKA
jgi:hypothetical protein